MTSEENTPNGLNKEETSSHVLSSVTDAAILDTLLSALQNEQAPINGSLGFKVDLKQELDLSHFRNRIRHSNIPLRNGQRIGKWKIFSLKYHHSSAKEPYLLVRCDCGVVKAKPQSMIQTGASKSCGCEKSNDGE